MVDVAALTSAGSAANMTPQGAAASAAASAASALASGLSDSGSASSTSGDIKFGDLNASSGFGVGGGLSTKKLLIIGGFGLAAMVLYGVFVKKK